MDQYFVVNEHGAIEGRGYVTHREALGFFVKMMKSGWDVESWHIVVMEGSSVGRVDEDRDVRTEPWIRLTHQLDARTSRAKCAPGLRACMSSTSPGESA